MEWLTKKFLHLVRAILKLDLSCYLVRFGERGTDSSRMSKRDSSLNRVLAHFLALSCF